MRICGAEMDGVPTLICTAHQNCTRLYKLEQSSEATELFDPFRVLKRMAEWHKE